VNYGVDIWWLRLKMFMFVSNADMNLSNGWGDVPVAVLGIVW